MEPSTGVHPGGHHVEEAPLDHAVAYGRDVQHPRIAAVVDDHLGQVARAIGARTQLFAKLLQLRLRVIGEPLHTGRQDAVLPIIGEHVLPSTPERTITHRTIQQLAHVSLSPPRQPGTDGRGHGGRERGAAW